MSTELKIDIGDPEIIFYTQTRVRHEIVLITKHNGDVVTTILTNCTLFGALAEHCTKVKATLKGEKSVLPLMLKREYFTTVVQGWALDSLSKFMSDVDYALQLARGNSKKPKDELQELENKSDLIASHIKGILAYPSD